MTDVFDCFKAYDVRGRIPDQLNEDIARRIGKGYAEVIQPGTGGGAGAACAGCRSKSGQAGTARTARHS